MFPILLSFLSVLLFAFTPKPCKAESICMDAPFPYKYASTTSCSAPRILNSTLSTFPSALTAGTSTLTLDFEVKLVTKCSISSANRELFGLTITKSDSTLIQIMRFYYSTSDSSYHLSGNFGSTTQSLQAISSTLSVGDPFHIFMKLRLTSGITNAKGIVAAPGVYGTITGALDVSASIKFDSTTRFVFCADNNGAAHGYCEIIGFATWYAFETASNELAYFAGLYPIPMAFFEFNQGSGYVVPDSYDNLGDAYLGASTATISDSTTSPIWNTADQGIKFSTINQYIVLPTFEISRYNVFRYSFSVSCWVKVSSSSYGYLLNYAGSDGTSKFSLFLNNDKKVYASISTYANSVNTVAITVNTWTLINVLFLHTDPPQTSSIAAYIGTQLQGTYSGTISPLISTASDDIVTIGPFDNPSVSIYDFKLWSPGAIPPEIGSTCSTPTSYCEISLGPPNLQNCLTCQSGYYIKNFACLQDCYIYSDDSCKMQCSYPYTPRNESAAAYCDFKCDSNKYLYPNGSCLSTCSSPSVKYQNLSDEWYCRGPCSDSSKFYYLDQKVCLTSCYDGYQEDDTMFYKRCLAVTTSEAIKTTIAVTGKAGTASKAVTQATTALSSGSPTGISASVAGKIFTNIKYLNISYSVELQDALESWGESFVSLGFLPDMPASIQAKIVSRPLPYMFEKYEVGSSFLLNFWDNLCFLVILTILFIFVKMLEIGLEKCSSKRSKLAAFRAMIQNFILTQLYSVYGDIIFYSTLEYRSIDLSLGLTSLSFSFSIVFLAIMLLCFGLHFFLLKKYQRIKNQAKLSNNQNLLDQFVESHKGNFVLFKDFKDQLILQQAFLLLLTARDLASSLIITTLFLHPLAQTIILLVLNVSMVAYLILTRPFDSLFDATQQLFYEIITLSVNVGVMIMAIMDVIDSIGYELRKELGKFLIIMNMIFNFGALGFMLIKGFMVSKEIYQSYKENKKQKQLKLCHLPVQRRLRTALNSQTILKSKETEGLESSVISLSMKQEISSNTSGSQALSLSESAMESSWDHPQSKRLIRIDPKKQKIKRKIKEVVH